MTTTELRDTRCHRLLLALAGRLPDDVLTLARRLLADGETGAAAQLVLATPATHGAGLTADQLAAARELAPSGAPGPDQDCAVAPGDADLPYVFAATGPEARRRADAVDDVVALTAEASAGQVAGLWRCWRLATSGDEPARRVYLVQTESLDDAPALAGTFYDALAEAGEPGAGVEVVALDDELEGYQRQALDAALLLWAGGGSAGPLFQVARVYDHADPQAGPGFSPDHPLLTDPEERELVLSYLGAGAPVLSTTARMPDPLDPAAGDVAPAGFLTDGEWIWTEAVGYFLERHGLAPDAELLSHIRSMDYTTAPADQETCSLAAEFLLRPSTEQSPTWTAEPS